MYYGTYLQLDKIIDAQSPESFKEGQVAAHDEMLFIIIHQAYELWFKQILFELNSVTHIMQKPAINDNTSDLQTVVHRLQRTVTILRVLVHQIDILETMTPMDFLNFRDMLRPASGFQSWQFKTIEARLGLKFEQRFGQEHYTSQLSAEDLNNVKRAEEESESILTLVNRWLERMPFADDAEAWQSTGENFWDAYHKLYTAGLAPAEQVNNTHYQNTFFENLNTPERSLSPRACRSALFILLYRGFPMLELPFQLLDTLLEIDNQLGNWRYRHINMVRRMIGTRIGTGGSTGAGYLQGAMDKHYIFKEIAQLNSFLIDRRHLPILPKAVQNKLGYAL